MIKHDKIRWRKQHLHDSEQNTATHSTGFQLFGPLQKDSIGALRSYIDKKDKKSATKLVN